MPANPPTHEPPKVSGFLAARAKAARAKAAEVLGSATPPSSTDSGAPRHAASQPAAPSQNQTAAAKRTPKTGKEAAQTAAEGKPEREIVPQPRTGRMIPVGRGAAIGQGGVITVGPLHSPDGTTGLDDDAVIAVFCRNAKGDPALVDLARPQLPRVMSAVLAGAQIAGAGGDKDRTRLFRMLGLSWADPPRVGDRRGDAAGSLVQLADRLGRAQARVAGRMRATLTQSLTLEAADDCGSEAIARLSTEQARYPTDDDQD